MSYEIAHGDLSPGMPVNITRDGVAVDCSTADTVELQWVKPDGTLHTNTLTPVDASVGQFIMAWAGDDTDQVGAYFGQVVIAEGGKESSYPNDGTRIIWWVNPNVNEYPINVDYAGSTGVPIDRQILTEGGLFGGGTLASDLVLSITDGGVTSSKLDASLSIAGTFTAHDLVMDGGTLLLQGTPDDAGRPTASATSERLRLKSLNPTNSRSSVQWYNSAGSPLWAMGNDYYLTNHNSFYIYDWTNNKYILRSFQQTGGTSSESVLSFGPSGNSGGLHWDLATSTLKLIASNAQRLYINPTGMFITTSVNYAGDQRQQWSSTTSAADTVDTAIGRGSAGLLEISNGTPGTYRDLGVRQIRMGSATGPLWLTGTGDPSGVVPAPIGSLYTRTDGGAGTTLYVKESGTGNTGWAAK